MTGTSQRVPLAAPHRFPLAGAALAELRRNPRRVVAVVVAIMISVGYLTASVTVLATEQATLERGVIARTAATDVVLTVAAGQPRVQQEVVDRVRAVAGVRSADLSYLSHGRVSGSAEWLQLQSLPDNPALRWSELVAGRAPAGPDEIALGATTARQLNVGIGDRLTVNDANSSTTLAVTGLTHDGASLLVGLAQNSFVAAAFYTGGDSIRESLQTEVLVIADGTVGADRLAEQIRAAVGGQADVETTVAFVERKLSEQTSGVLIFQVLLLMFGAIALLVGGIMIVNTFLVLVAQRRRQIGLTRAVGASRAQVLRGLLAEAVAVGAVGSALGIGAGIGVSAIAAAVLEQTLSVPALRVAAVGLVGVVVTVLAVLVPARRAARLVPLEALRPVADERTSRRASRGRATRSAVLLLAGLGMIAAGFPDSGYGLPLSVAGAFLAAAGLLVAAGTYLPAMLRLSGSVLGRLGPTARLAAANTVRNPGRAAATGTALILAVGLVVTMQVGAASMKAGAEGDLARRFPVDVTLSMFDGALPGPTVAQVAAIPGVATAAGVRSARVNVGGTDLRVLGPGPDAAAAASTGGDRINDRTVLADPYLLADLGVAAGQPLSLTGPAGSVTLPVEASFLAPAEALVVSPAVLERLDPGAPVATVWARTAAEVDITELRSRLRTVAEPITGAEVGGSLSARATYDELLDRLLAVATALLAVAVLIALIGVGNTLGLSVLERTRESALLRALGLSGGRLRLMLAAEAVLLSLSATMVGIGAGVFFGWVGTRALSAELNIGTVELAVSPVQTLAVAAVAVVAALLASVLPGRRAAGAAPVDALAES